MINIVIQLSVSLIILLPYFTFSGLLKSNFNNSLINLTNYKKAQEVSTKICTNTRIEDLISQLQTLKGSSVEITFILNELVSCDSQAVPALIKVFENEQEKVMVRRIVARALGKIGSQEAISVLVKVAINKKSPVYDSAIRALDDSALGLIFLVTADPLQQMPIDRQKAIPLLVQALSHEDENIRSAAAEALGKIGLDAQIAIPNLIGLVEDKSRTVRAEAINALAQTGKAGINALIEAIKNKKISFSSGAIALVQLEDNSNVRDVVKRATPYLLDAFHNNKIAGQDRWILVQLLNATGQTKAADEVFSALINSEESRPILQRLQPGGAELALEAATSRGIAREPAICRFSFMRRILWRCR
ncbi:HEAT repeat domain-containing protein [Nostoc sp. TCL26-01]|uniref:HEAT repeat domain-containing protein n=1 Tax=Nostoc sp. TCL26-01 TaxID=2576904 RepID=UPI0015BBDC03|nr:HEAT repeat domain-containing protein [Nostoc sp. TCL26-01]QLE54382.1 HEAT repeat domain-containing protein [Nostoc sp. TCL26-01]